VHKCARLLRQPKFVQWWLIFVGPQYGTGFLFPFWHLEFWGGNEIFGKFVSPVLTHCLIPVRGEGFLMPPVSWQDFYKMIKTISFLFWNILSCSWLDEMFTLKVRYSSVHCKDFVIVYSVIAGWELAEQAHAAKC
jgi:hypothetical protein